MNSNKVYGSKPFKSFVEVIKGNIIILFPIVISVFIQMNSKLFFTYLIRLVFSDLIKNNYL